jgi:ribosomal-protein-alanine N-acetyltransferase
LSPLAPQYRITFRPELIEGKSVMSVRFADEKDLAKVLEIERLSFSDPWDHHGFKTTLKHIFLVFDEQDISGYLIAVCCYKNIRGTIMKIAVHPEHRRKGIGTALLNHCLEILKEKKIIDVCLNVEMTRKPAIALYEKFGFKITKTIHMDYEDDLSDDAFHVMQLIL